MDAPQDGSKKREGLHQRGTMWCQSRALLVSMEPDVITSGAQGKVVWLQLVIELTNKVLDLQDESGYRPWFQIREQGGEGY